MSFKIKREKVGDRPMGKGHYGYLYPYGKKSAIKVTRGISHKDLPKYINELVLGFGHVHPRIIPIKKYSLFFENPGWELVIKMKRMSKDLDQVIRNKTGPLEIKEFVNQL